MAKTNRLSIAFAAAGLFNACTAAGPGAAPKNDSISPIGAMASLESQLLLDSKDARDGIARQIEEFLKTQDASADKENARTLTAILNATAKAFRNGAHSLCRPEERLTFYRGTGRVARARTNRPLELALGGRTARSVTELFQAFSMAVKYQGNDLSAVHPLSFTALTGRHSGDVNSTNSVFVSVSASPDVAAQFGSNILEVSLCPDRAVSTTTQFWGEAEFLPIIALLPEEIVSIKARTEAADLPQGILSRCYAPYVGTGSEVLSKTVSTENLARYNALVVEKIEAAQDTSWKSVFEGFLEGHCTCEKMVARKNALFLERGSGDPGFFKVSEECKRP